MVTVISQDEPVASALGGGIITAGGTIVRGSFPSAGFQTAPRIVRGGTAVTPTPTVTPTLAEEELQQSLPADLRELSVEEVLGGRTIERQLQEQVQQDFGDIRQQTRIDIEVPRERVGVREVLFGEVGKPFVGFDIFPRIAPPFIPREKDVSLQQIQTFFRAAPTDISLPRFPLGRGVADVLPRPLEFAGFGIRVGAELIPTTPGEVGITGALIGATILAPPIIGTGISLGVSGLGIRTAFDPGLTFEQRAAGGLVGVLGGVGFVAGVTPFVRGIGAKGVKVAPEGFQVLPEFKGVGDIGLIQPKRGALDFVDLPPTSPLVKGAFKFRTGEKAKFLGIEQLLTTSQREFFKTGRDIPIEREFFVTPQEPTLGIAETRISRLGLQDPFKFPESVEIGFGLPPRPQIGITIGEVARTERAGAFRIGTGTELEAIRTTGIITDVAQIGRVRIRGQGVDIFEFEIGRVPRRRGRARRPPEDFVSTEPLTRVSGETLLGTLAVKTTRGISASTAALVSPLLTRGISPEISLPISPTISPPTIPISPGISDLISPGLIPTVPIVSPPSIISRALTDFEDPFRRIRIPRRAKKKPKKKKKRKGIITPIRVSFTGIVLGIEKAARITPGLGVLPGEIRGLATGFNVPKRKKKGKATKKKSVKKKK